MTDDRRSPADASDELHFRLKVEQGLSDIAEGRFVTDNETRIRFAKWLNASILSASDPGATPTGGQV